jgi:GAF domain-containing protein
VGERLGWDAAVWWEATGGGLRAEFHWVSGMAEAPAGLDALLGSTLTAGQGLAGRVLAGGRPLWLDEVMDEAGACPQAAVAAGAGLRTTMAFPVRAGDRTYGVAQLLMRGKLPVDEALLETVAVVGRTTGLAMRTLR